MKNYLLEIFLDKDNLSHREKSDGGITINELRLIISLLDELKLRMLNTVMSAEQEIDLKDKKPND